MHSRRFHLNWLTGSTLVFVAVMTLLCILFLPKLHEHDATPASLPTLPDAYMEDVVALVMDKQGKPKMKIISPKMIHYAKDDKTLLTTPQLTLYRKSPQPWYISSKTAEAIQGTEHVLFKENVVIQHAADINNPATVIKTTTLLVHPDAQIAETNDAITLLQPNLVVNGTGMHADINKGDIKLLSDARGEYVPG